MGRIMNRDKELIKFLDESQVILTTEEIADLFYTASTKNSSITIARRRLKILSELGYINCIKGSMGESNKFCSISSFLPPFIKKYTRAPVCASAIGSKYSAPVSVVIVNPFNLNVRMKEKRLRSLLICEYGNKIAFFLVICNASPPA